MAYTLSYVDRFGDTITAGNVGTAPGTLSNNNFVLSVQSEVQIPVGNTIINNKIIEFGVPGDDTLTGAWIGGTAGDGRHLYVFNSKINVRGGAGTHTQFRSSTNGGAISRDPALGRANLNSINFINCEFDIETEATHMIWNLDDLFDCRVSGNEAILARINIGGVDSSRIVNSALNFGWLDTDAGLKSSEVNNGIPLVQGANHFISGAEFNGVAPRLRAEGIKLFGHTANNVPPGTGQAVGKAVNLSTAAFFPSPISNLAVDGAVAFLGVTVALDEARGIICTRYNPTAFIDGSQTTGREGLKLRFYTNVAYGTANSALTITTSPETNRALYPEYEYITNANGRAVYTTANGFDWNAEGLVNNSVVDQFDIPIRTLRTTTAGTGFTFAYNQTADAFMTNVEEISLLGTVAQSLAIQSSDYGQAATPPAGYTSADYGVHQTPVLNRGIVDVVDPLIQGYGTTSAAVIAGINTGVATDFTPQDFYAATKLAVWSDSDIPIGDYPVNDVTAGVLNVSGNTEITGIQFLNTLPPATPTRKHITSNIAVDLVGNRLLVTSTGTAAGNDALSGITLSSAIFNNQVLNFDLTKVGAAGTVTGITGVTSTFVHESTATISVGNVSGSVTTNGDISNLGILDGATIVANDITFPTPIVTTQRDNSFITADNITAGVNADTFGDNMTYTARTASNLTIDFASTLTTNAIYTAEDLLGDGYTITPGDTVTIDSDVAIFLETADAQVLATGSTVKRAPIVRVDIRPEGTLAEIRARGGYFNIVDLNTGNSVLPGGGVLEITNSTTLVQMTAEKEGTDGVFRAIYKPTSVFGLTGIAYRTTIIDYGDLLVDTFVPFSSHSPLVAGAGITNGVPAGAGGAAVAAYSLLGQIGENDIVGDGTTDTNTFTNAAGTDSVAVSVERVFAVTSAGVITDLTRDDGGAAGTYTLTNSLFFPAAFESITINGGNVPTGTTIRIIFTLGDLRRMNIAINGVGNQLTASETQAVSIQAANQEQYVQIHTDYANVWNTDEMFEPGPDSSSSWINQDEGIQFSTGSAGSEQQRVSNVGGLVSGTVDTGMGLVLDQVIDIPSVAATVATVQSAVTAVVGTELIDILENQVAVVDNQNNMQTAIQRGAVKAATYSAGQLVTSTSDNFNNPTDDA